jgi:maltose phosphorylase
MFQFNREKFSIKYRIEMIKLSNMNDGWRIEENGFNPDENRFFESLMSSGNGLMGIRGNFEEQYSGDTFKGTYIAGVYYPDKTRVGWWKNGYPAYFAKVLNAPDYIGIDVCINGIQLDIAKVKFADYSRVLDMKTSTLTRKFIYISDKNERFLIESIRFLSYADPELAAIHYAVTPLDADCYLEYTPFLNTCISNEDSNYNERFFQFENSTCDFSACSVTAKTKKTDYLVSAAFAYDLTGCKVNSVEQISELEGEWQGIRLKASCKKGESATLIKYISVLSSRYHSDDCLLQKVYDRAILAKSTGFEALYHAHIEKWADIWKNGDIMIEGDLPAQQGIRFNIYQLNCTYSGEDDRLNIGPKGFTGEKYGGSTYWDTEAYCIYFYLGTRKSAIARQLLMYRYHHLEKAKENAKQLGLKGALYPMVTMTGEECHNEWEITFEEIHRNSAIAYAIYYYTEYTQDESYIQQFGIDVLTEITRFWASRVNFSKDKNAYVILGVTGPNEYENNVNNNWYTNRMAKWCLEYTASCLKQMQMAHENIYQDAVKRLGITQSEMSIWADIAGNLYLPYDKERQVFIQQDGFLDKELLPASSILKDERPINKNWSWDRILRSCFIKQADVLQGLWFLGDQYSLEEKKRNFDFYEPMTLHESSLSPCVHSIIAAEIGNTQKAYELYLQTARLDLDNKNHDTNDGLHITSMAGSFMSIVYGFGGVRIKKGELFLNPYLPETWQSYTFNIMLRDALVHVRVCKKSCVVKAENEISFTYKDKAYQIKAGGTIQLER